MKKIFLLIALCLSLVGCTTTEEVITVKSWEGHYLTTNDFYKATKEIELKDGESIWVLSNKTLKRTLKEAYK